MRHDPANWAKANPLLMSGPDHGRRNSRQRMMRLSAPGPAKDPDLPRKEVEYLGAWQ
jgi:hypothetical protein